MPTDSCSLARIILSMTCELWPFGMHFVLVRKSIACSTSPEQHWFACRRAQNPSPHEKSKLWDLLVPQARLDQRLGMLRALIVPGECTVGQEVIRVSFLTQDSGLGDAIARALGEEFATRTIGQWNLSRWPGVARRAT